MDTPCIPENRELRGQAIANIKVFYESKVTSVCDRDLVDIDIEDLTLSKKESILATVSYLFTIPT